MAQFSRSVDSRSGLTVISAVGTIAPGEMLACNALQEPALRTPLLLWDLSQANWAGLPTHALLRDFDSMRGLSEHNVRTAFVLSNEVDYGMGRIIESYTEIQGFTGRYRPFRTLEEALDWVQHGDEESHDLAMGFGL